MGSIFGLREAQKIVFEIGIYKGIISYFKLRTFRSFKSKETLVIRSQGNEQWFPSDRKIDDSFLCKLIPINGLARIPNLYSYYPRLFLPGQRIGPGKVSPFNSKIVILQILVFLGKSGIWL